MEFLNLLTVKPEDIKDDEALFGEGLGLDSIDSIELIVLLNREYGVVIEDPKEGRKILMKQKYRERLASGNLPLRWVYLKGDFDLIRGRLEARKNHYMKAGLLESQFAALEEPQNAIVAEVGPEPGAIADFVLRQLQVTPAGKSGPN